jgi:hypothetical protein
VAATQFVEPQRANYVSERLNGKKINRNIFFIIAVGVDLAVFPLQDRNFSRTF